MLVRGETPNHERDGQVIMLVHEKKKKDGKRRMYVEIYVEQDGKQSLQSRQTDRNGVSEVLKELQGERFTISLICNRCIVGYGTYHFANESVVIECEEGAGIGFLDRLFH